ncbi:MAG: DNA adenine methylase [bacterium]|nr:DNA adenine methylase [bacterium]
MPKNKTTILVDARPFLKWAGGKAQLLPEISKRLPKHVLESKTIPGYIEPFIGGGALFFYLMNHFKIKKAFILDINCELITAYKTIQHSPEKLIEHLKLLRETFLEKEQSDREKYYYHIREEFNKHPGGFQSDGVDSSWIQRTAQLIFLNKTCYNGLFRKNRSGEFNVPFGKYKKPTIFTEENINAVSSALQKTDIIKGDFKDSEKFVTKESFVYLDPPYRPLNKTSNFTGYSEFGFTDTDQERLFRYFQKVDKKKAYALLSNSDPRNENKDDDFFDKLYQDYHISRVGATRMINSNSAKRGKINEILVTNYQ